MKSDDTAGDASRDELEPEPLTAAERARWRALREGPRPPPALERALVRELRARGALAPARAPRLRRLAGLAAAGLLGLVAGLAWRAAPGAEHADDGRRYLLLVRRDPAAPELDADETARRVAEYGRWARSLGARLADGAHLADERLLLHRGDDGAVEVEAAPPDALGGFFLLRAPASSAAIALARTCPHLAHGGLLELRPLDG